MRPQTAPFDPKKGRTYRCAPTKFPTNGAKLISVVFNDKVLKFMQIYVIIYLILFRGVIIMVDNYRHFTRISFYMELADKLKIYGVGVRNNND